ncbi:MAG TPA: CAP domain-containing protein [Terriglobales bacterium]|nr:CAP domain-containing protein [Terriglobales bacterium]
MKYLFVIALVIAFRIGAQAQFDPGAERLVVQQLNDSRLEKGLVPLKINPRLVEAARQHSLVMARRHQLTHQASGEPNVQQRLAATGLHFNRSGENVGFNDREDQIHWAFMHSPPHRANILTPEYNAVGIGIVHQESEFWVTEDFATVVATLNTEQAEAQAAKAFAELRQQEHMMPLGRLNMPQLRDSVCAMAQSGNMNNGQLMQTPGVRYVVTYSNSQPEVLPSDVQRIAAQPGLKRFAVGSCFVQNEKDPGGIFWTAMLFF